jgi:hypothetical protein
VEGGEPGAPRLVRLSLVSLALAAIRLACGLVVLSLSFAVGGKIRVELIAFALGAFAAGALVTGDPRRRHRRLPAPEPLPARVELESWRSVAREEVFPSTVVVTGFGLIALAFQPTLAALLGGVLAGMAAASLVVWLEIGALERRFGGTLYGQRGVERLYLEAEPARTASSRSRS